MSGPVITYDVYSHVDASVSEEQSYMFRIMCTLETYRIVDLSLICSNTGFFRLLALTWTFSYMTQGLPKHHILVILFHVLNFVNDYVMNFVVPFAFYYIFLGTIVGENDIASTK